MLTPEQAKALQEQRQYISDEPRRLKAIDWLPGPLRPIAYGLLYRDAQGKPLPTNWELQAERYALQERAITQLDTLSPHERTLIFAAFFPSVAECIELGWMYLRGLPYERATYDGQEFFRAPHRPEATLRVRGIWLPGLLGMVGPHDDLAWLARHAAYINPNSNHLGLFFAAVIDADPAHGGEVFEILVRSARGEDEVGTFGRHIPVALLAASRPEGWECVEQLLLGAQREEGVRQTILEALAVAHPGAFRRILGTILDHDLVRFSAITRAVNGWLETTWDSAQAPATTRVLRGLYTLLGEPDARAAALESGSGEDAYLALWATAYEDICAALPLAEHLLDDAEVTRRYAAARLLATAHVPEATALLLRALDDPDGRVVAQACAGLRFNRHHNFNVYNGSDRGERLRRGAPAAFERIEAELARLPRQSAPAQPVLWNVAVPPLDRERVADLLLEYLDERDPKRLIPHLGMLSSYGRTQAAQRLAARDLDDPEVRATLFVLLKDRTSLVRSGALALLLEAPIRESEAPALEALLGRTSEELRRGVLGLLLKQPSEMVLASAGRLLGAVGEHQRLAGLEALRLLHEAGRDRPACAALATRYRQRHREPSAAEQALLAPILEGERVVPTLENALGLVRLDELTAPVAPEPREQAWTSPAAVAGLRALDGLIHEHRADAYVVESWQGRQEVLLGSDVWRFPQPDAKVTIGDDVARLPFADLWRGWTEARGESLRDGDGLELLRMLIEIERREADGIRAILGGLGAPGTPEAAEASEPPGLPLRYPAVLGKLCWWLVRLCPPPGATDFLLDHLETTLAQIPEHELRDAEDPAQRPRYRQHQPLQRSVALVRAHGAQCRGEWTDAHAARLWRLLRWSVALPQEHLRYRPRVAETLAAHRSGAASEADLVYQFLGPRPMREFGPTIIDELHTFSARKPHALLAEYPVAGAVYARCMRRVLDVELRRGEMATAATDAALSLRSLGSAETFLAVLRALEGEGFARGHGYAERGTSKSHALSHLLRATFPGEGDTVEVFRELMRAAGKGLRQGRLVEAAVYAPQWARHVEGVLGWDGFAQGVWWVHAHTKDHNWAVDQEIRAEWEAEISEWTPLSGADLSDGAVDVAWFRRVIAALGAERWEVLYQAAKYSSGGTGHTRARLFADAMLGRVDAATLMGRIGAKRHRDAACALGLLALPESPAEREAAILARYQALQGFVRTAQALGAQRREGDQKAARIGLDNLARTAGYADPARFQWAIELQEVADLAAGPLRVTRDAATLALEVDPLGQPHLRVEKAGKPLKVIPSRLKNDADVVALRERQQRLEQQGTRMRAALEQAMCREEPFGAGELVGLLRHPLLAPILEQLVFVGPACMGYLVSSGAALRTLDGDVALDPETPLRIAHPHDLHASGAWSSWQRECFVAERIQPFKQIFRELYPLTEAERRDGARSQRYAGHQLKPQQAMALLARRGWVTSAQEGGATRTFHWRGITVSVDFLSGGGTPVAVEGLTIEGVVFHAASEAWGKPLPLRDIPPVLFSEAMRDLDLVVSVAHRGEIDPEGSASTVGMRAALVREVCAALALGNVRIQSSHAVVAGTLGEYSVHLGSGVVHRLPGGSLCIVPVHAQHRGRLFLPFADDDPKTAEIVSKVLLLARDAEIKDPLILEQIYARA